MISDNLVSTDALELEPDHASPAFTADKFSTQAIRNKDGSKNHYQTLKSLLRTTRIGINDPVRKTLWLDLALAFNPANNAEDFDPQFDNLTSNKLPQFVDATNARFFALNPKARHHVATILWNLAQCMLTGLVLCHLTEPFPNTRSLSADDFRSAAVSLGLALSALSPST